MRQYFGLPLDHILMITGIFKAAALTLLLLAFGGCTNTQPAYYGTYPSDFEFGPNHGYEPYAAAPHDPVGSYYQNYAPATPYYYEPPESHRDCDQRPCIAYQRQLETGPKAAPTTSASSAGNSSAPIAHPAQGTASTIAPTNR